MDYKELLKDGRWQVKKTQIMQRDNFTCRMCGAKAADGTTLNVHHIQYRRDAKPWEYEDCELVTLCENCHKAHHDEIKSHIFNLKVGDFIAYCHSDFINTGVVYDIDWNNMRAKLASIDDGSDYSMLWLGMIFIKPDGSLDSNDGWYVHREPDVELDYDPCDDSVEHSHNGTFFTFLAECLLHIRDYYEDSNTTHFYTIHSDTDALHELCILNKNLDTILQNNEQLKEFFYRNDAL
jgi:hypothetical protein